MDKFNENDVQIKIIEERITAHLPVGPLNIIIR